ncbi:Na+/H+ antiporter [Ktedonosporobacter rubrisoli]|uniref:Na+/H+ antiporter n=1 Tax=Ktedonosporobacter rubrisoli TaxID=2509675 RepID=A0A4P6JMD2_KTERU|nr:Na+/H+ antiporter [Ktedonosporobacter rubrisoli]QBD76395.1 Na+/H+ antiporter [Ktedonosporobacter rubrisoli]
MNNSEIILALLFIMVMLVALARRIQLPYPILLVLAGLGISFIPGLPRIELDPDLVFVLFLPPILQLSAYNTPIRDFRANLQAIGLLAIGLVLATTVAVALVAHFVLGLPWPIAFVLGAIVAPPDAVAASSIAERLKLPRRIVTLLEGESLVNDATALVAYRVAIAAVTTGSFSLIEAGSQFLLASAGGVVIGIIIGLLVTPIFRRLTEDVPVYLMLTFLSGYGAYLLAETFHTSGVVAVVTLGIFYGQPRFNTMTPDLRLQGTAIWDMVVFALNGLIFILLGLQLPIVLQGLSEPPLTLMGYAAIVCATLILIRIIWVFPGAYVPRLLRGESRDQLPSWQNVTILGWTGMRGIVTLAAALSLPLVKGMPFPHRNLIIFLAFVVILVTLVLQGLSLPALIQVLKVVDDGSAEREEHKARLKAAMAGKARLEELAQNNLLTEGQLKKLTHRYEGRTRLYRARYQGEQDEQEERNMQMWERAEQELLQAELDAILALRNEEIINDEILRRVQRDLDLELLRLRNNPSQWIASNESSEAPTEA